MKSVARSVAVTWNPPLRARSEIAWIPAATSGCPAVPGWNTRTRAGAACAWPAAISAPVNAAASVYIHRFSIPRSLPSKPDDAEFRLSTYQSFTFPRPCQALLVLKGETRMLRRDAALGREAP